MLSLAAGLVLLLPLALVQDEVQDDVEKGPSQEEVAAALAEVRSALANRDKDVRAEVLARQRLAVREVIDLVARGLKDPEDEVRQATLESLRWTEHERALEILQRSCRRDKKLREHETLGALLYKAVGQHSDPSSIELLADDLFNDRSDERIRTRLLALGRIRDLEAVETLVDLSRAADKQALWPHRREWRTSLMVLTGIDRGEAFEPWQAWWKENRRTFELPEEPPLLRREDQQRWDAFWGEEARSPRRERREDRGSKDS